ncbi:MAG: hypothetical protein WA902_24595 [Thermosynechococcaceae cyanobacterium]
MTGDKRRWQLFLNELAFQVDLTRRETEVFIYYFELEREHLSNPEIRESFVDENNIGLDYYNNLINGICDKMSELGINYEENRGTRLELIWRFLRQRYPKWEKKLFANEEVSTRSLWMQLKELGRYAPEKMGIYISENHVQRANALPIGYQNEPFLRNISKGTDGLRFKIKYEGMGQVLLLNCDQEDEVFCLCPSRFAPEINLRNREMEIPQPESQYACLGAAVPGKEEWLAWIVNDLPPLTWLGAARNTALQLSIENLEELVTQVELMKGKVLYSYYRVV